MKRIKKIKRRVAALVISFFLTLGLTAPAFNFTVKAEALEVANSTCSVADMIFSYCASGGVAVMNETIIDEVYNVLGTSFGTLQTFVDNGLLTYSDGQYVDTGLSANIDSAISNISSIDIASLFNQTSEQNPTGVALTGAGSLAGIAGSVATTGVLPVVAGVAVTGYCGFQIGTLIANFLGLYGEPVTKGLPLDVDRVVLNQIENGNAVATVQVGTGEYKYTYIITGPGVSYAYYDSTLANPYIVGVDSVPRGKNNYKLITSRADGYLAVNTYNAYSKNTSGKHSPYAANVFTNYNDYSNAMSGWRNGTVTPKVQKSPDVIGENGNVQGEYDSENNSYNIPNAIPQLDPENESINPTGITFNDWINYANSIANNNTDPSTGDDANKNIFDDIKTRIILPTPTPSPEPEPEPNPDPNPNPDPETVPAPDVNPYPDTYPVADPDTVPVNKEQPQYTEKATENETDIVEGDPYTTPDLLDKFPFCIPRDILRAFKKLDSGSREAPHIQWRFHPNEMIDYTFDVDFSTWDNVAVLLRLLELLGFIVLLGIATRNLILS